MLVYKLLVKGATRKGYKVNAQDLSLPKKPRPEKGKLQQPTSVMIRHVNICKLLGYFGSYVDFKLTWKDH